MEVSMVPIGESATISSAMHNKSTITFPPIRMSGNFSKKDEENPNSGVDFNQMRSNQDTCLGDPKRTGNESIELEVLLDKGQQ